MCQDKSSKPRTEPRSGLVSKPPSSSEARKKRLARLLQANMKRRKAALKSKDSDA